MAIELTGSEYAFLLANARSYEQSTHAEGLSPLTDAVQREIDLRNNIRRYLLNVRWQDIGGQPPTRIEIGRGWPATQTGVLEMERAITADDVEAYVAARASNPVDIAVTKDLTGEVGWTLVEDWNFEDNA